MFTIQNAREQKQEKCLRDDHLFKGGIPVWHTPVCAWCLSEQNLPAGEGSHGICKMHANRLLLQQRKLRGQRVETTAEYA